MEQSLDRISPEFITKVWRDPEFKERLIRDPSGTLRSEGFRVPEGRKIVFHEDSDNVTNLVIPSPPSVRSLSDEDLIEIASRKLEAQLELTIKVV
jgi:hypothetical protein